MRKVVCLLIAIVIMIPMAFVSACDDDSGADVTWRLITYQQEGSINVDTFNKFAELVEEKTDGKMEITVFPGDTLFSSAEAFDAISTGNVEVGEATVATTFGILPLTNLSFFAGLQLGGDVWDVVKFNRDLLQLPEIQAELDDNDVMMMLDMSAGYIEWCFTSSVESLDDMSGQKIRSFGGIGDAWIQMLGSTPVTIPAAEMYLSAETGLIDGSMAAVGDYIKMKLNEVMPYFVITKLILNPYPTFFHKPSFEALDEDLQAAVLEAESEAEEWGLQQVLAAQEDLVQELDADPDVHIVYLSESDRSVLLNTVILPAVQGMITSQISADWWTKLEALAENI